MPEQGEAKHKTVGRSRTVQALAIVGITSGYIIGPMAILGGIGWWLTNRYDSKLFILGFILLALVVSNLLIFRNTEKVLKKLS